MNHLSGQQISWMAARSITHRFIRLYNPSIPENPTDDEYVFSLGSQEYSIKLSVDYTRRKAITFFPAPHQVASTELTVLRTAGLSGRKAEYSRWRPSH